MLRKKVSATLTNLNPVEVDRESKKPHGIFEISDMDLPFSRNGETYHICMPFKSGREIRTDTVPYEVISQVYRPFVRLRDKCIVVFVTAKNCSQYFLSEVKTAIASYNWQIRILQGKELASLLKINNQL